MPITRTHFSLGAFLFSSALRLKNKTPMFTARAATTAIHWRMSTGAAHKVTQIQRLVKEYP